MAERVSPLLTVTVAAGDVATWASSGIVVPGTDVPYSVDYATGGIFSVDGLNFTPAGNALFANEFIKAINDRFDAELPLISPLCYARE